MRKIVLYIAMSLDGYIADKNGGVSWLSGDGSDPENIGSYPNFINTVDTVILGYKTYTQIINELSPNAWVYADKVSYVITHNHLENQENIFFTNNLEQLIVTLKNENGKDVWICGGAGIANQLLDLNLIDRFHITIMPTVLGSGMHLFDTHNKELPLKLISMESYNGVIDIVYERRK